MRAQMSAAEPSAAMLGRAPRRRVRRELRRALRDQRVLGADEGPVGHVPGEDDLATLAERIGHGAAVEDEDAWPAAAAVVDHEAQGVALAMDRVGSDLAGELVRASGGRRGDQL